MSIPGILLYGNAPDLIETRRLILKHAGFDVTAALTLKRVKELLGSYAFDLVILCHTLSSDDCESALLQVHTLQPAVKNLILCKPLSSRNQSERDAYFTAFVSPDTLIAAARDLTVDVGSSTEKGKVDYVQGKC